VNSLRKTAVLSSMSVRRFYCLPPLVLTAGSLNPSSFYAEANLHWINFALLVLFAVTGILLCYYLRQIRQHSRNTAELAELRASNVALGEHEQRFRDQLAETRMALEVVHAGTFSIDLTTGAITWSDELHRIYGLKPEEFGGRLEDWLECVLPEDRSRALAEYQSNSEHGSGISSEFRIRRRNDGEVRWLEARGQVLFDLEKRPQRMVGINNDVTERLREKEELRALEEQFRHSQKMEAVGRLAAGVAHDFNNFLMVIRSYTELIQESLPAGEVLHRYAQEVLNASARAAGLTTQLLAFSRKRILNLAVLNPNTVVNDATKMLKRLIGDDINVQVLADEPIWPIRADADQIVQILMNLCVNARDAMPRGGTITIQICNSTVDERGLANNAYVVPGAYVVLSVEDTGVGMSKKDMEHMFDPFFTTKPVGGGTGLGLSTVYGIVKQSNGYVWADSEIGKGTRFNIYFPKADETSLPTVAFRTEMTQLCGTETVLVVEDESAVREGICEFLRQCGYTVLFADSGEQSLLISGRYAGTIDLLIADQVLARMGGRGLSQMLIKLRPEVKVIYMSGPSDRPALDISSREHAKAFLYKPFSLTKLAQTMRDVLAKAEDSDSDSRSA
jgi:two-component system, cell cycle sensor histidine kinase and response regulator CckA